MAQSINKLAVGSKVIDEKGNKFIVIAKNHYMSNSVLLWAEDIVTTMIMGSLANTMSSFDYSNSEVQYYLNNNYPKILGNIKDYVLNTQIKYTNIISLSQSVKKSLTAKYFILGFNDSYPIYIPLYKDSLAGHYPKIVSHSWERDSGSDTETIYFTEDGKFGYYCSCGSPVDYYDLCDSYKYDKETNTIKLNCREV